MPGRHIAGFAVLAAAALVAAGAASATAAPTSAAPSAPTSAKTADLASLVNPFVGTENFGNTFPGASAPFGMVQVSPDTGGQGGYDYKGQNIFGFSQTHLSGVGCGVVGELPVMPTTGDVTSGDYTKYQSPFTHDDEQATPGYYRVGLSKYGINTELTATDRTGWQRYTFPSGTQHNVLFNTGKANMPVLDSEVHVVGDDTIEGKVHDGGFCAGHDQHTAYFTATFSKPFASYGTWTGDTLSASNRDTADKSGNQGAWVTFGADAGNDVTLKVGLSYTGLDGARANMKAETGTGFDFDATRAALTKRWNQQLALATIRGGTHDRRVAYYTALYHAMLHPNLSGDVDGSYYGFDNKVHKAVGYTPRANFSLWDTYRTQNELVEMLAPQVSRDDALSLLAIGREGGWLPRWALENSETNIMTGDPITPTLVEAWSKGFLAGHEAEAYAMLKKYTTQPAPKDSQYNGRAGVAQYDKLGYIPYGLKLGQDCPDHGGDNDCAHPASATLEYSAADASLSTMADALGHAKDARMFSERGRWYRNLWDSRIGQFRPRMSDGTWLAPYDPVSGDTAFHESGAYQYTWLVPQDPAGLVDLIGGRQATEKRLDTFFAYDRLLTNPDKAIHDDWISSPYDYYSKSTYNPNNEPDLIAPYMYAWVGQPAKTATVNRAAFRLFTTGADGMTGNDDLGEMSSWYVMSSLGVYPTMSGSRTFVLTTPQFPSADVTVGTYAGQGGTLHITAPGASDKNRYVTSATVNGKSTPRTWIPWDAIAHGGTLAYTVSSTPGSWGTKAKDAPPSIDTTATDNRTTFAGTVSPAEPTVATGSTTATVTASMVAQWPGTKTVTTVVHAPDGWTADPARTSTDVHSDTLPTGVDKTIALHIPKDTPAGTYPVTVTMRAAGVDTIAKTVHVTLEDASCASTSSGSCALDLSKRADLDGTATTSAPDSGNFDGGGWSFDADLLPAQGTTTLDGVPYAMPDPTGTTKNFVTARGQSLAVPAAAYKSLHVVGAAHGGDVTSAITVYYTDGSSESVPFAMTDWAGSNPASGTSFAVRMAHRIKAGQGVDGPPVNLFADSLSLDAGKTVQSIALPDASNAEVYAATFTG